MLLFCSGHHDSTVVVDNECAADRPPMGHVAKKMTMGVGEDGVPIGSLKRIDDHAKSTKEDPLGRIEVSRQSLMEAQGSKVVDHQHNEVLLQISLLCHSVQQVGMQMQEEFVKVTGDRKAT